MSRRRQAASALLAGSAGGVAGFAAFLVIHAIWIVPIWFIAPTGLVFGVAGGAATGWAWHVHREHLPARTGARALLLFGAAVVVLLPSEAVALLFAPADPRTLAGQPVASLLSLIGVYVAAAALLGAIAGGLLGRSWAAAAVTGLAAAVFGAGIGHNAPLLGHSWVAGKMWTIMLSASAAAAVAFALVERALSVALSSARSPDAGTGPRDEPAHGRPAGRPGFWR